MRRVDKLGRIVIPLELRRRYGLLEGSKIEFLETGDGVTVRSSEPFCKVCRAKISDSAEFPLCEECLLKAVESYKEK